MLYSRAASPPAVQLGGSSSKAGAGNTSQLACLLSWFPCSLLWEERDKGLRLLRNVFLSLRFNSAKWEVGGPSEGISISLFPHFPRLSSYLWSPPQLSFPSSSNYLNYWLVKVDLYLSCLLDENWYLSEETEQHVQPQSISNIISGI